MNDLQRQLLADRLDEIGRSIDSYTKAIAELERRLLVKETRLKELKDQKAQLEEGVDW